jgi:hypothetical protein
MTTIRMPSELHKALREIVKDDRASLHSLILEGARLAAEKHQIVSPSVAKGATS